MLKQPSEQIEPMLTWRKPKYLATTVAFQRGWPFPGYSWNLIKLTDNICCRRPPFGAQGYPPSTPIPLRRSYCRLRKVSLAHIKIPAAPAVPSLTTHNTDTETHTLRLKKEKDFWPYEISGLCSPTLDEILTMYRSPSFIRQGRRFVLLLVSFFLFRRKAQFSSDFEFWISDKT